MLISKFNFLIAKLVFLAEKDSLEELNLADNAYMDKQLDIQYGKPTNEFKILTAKPHHI